MKIRSGFVGNSSSSSFLVALSKVPKSANELFKMMFPCRKKGEEIDYPYKDQEEKLLSLFEISKVVFRDIKKKISIKEISNILRIYVYLEFYRNNENCHSENYYQWYNLKREMDDILNSNPNCYQKKDKESLKQQKRLEIIEIEQHSIITKECEVQAIDFVNKYKNQNFFIFEYSDGDSFGSQMEHSDIFRNLPHLTISNH